MNAIDISSLESFYENNFSRLVYPKEIIFTILLMTIFLFACSRDTQVENPAWINKLIKQFESQPEGNPPQSIWRYDYFAQVVYFVPARCCDIPSTVYDADGNIICTPDGGITGEGDGRCPDFFSTRNNEQLIWKYPNTR
jgi:Domain of unknown function (DUF6970)